MRGYKDQRLQNQPWRARSCSSKAHQSCLSSGPSHMILHRVLSLGQMFIHSTWPETPTTLRLSIAIGSRQHFPAFYLPCISFSSSDFFLYLKVDNFQYVLLLVAHWEFSVLPAGKTSRPISDQDKDLVPSGYLLKTITFVLTEVQWRSANPRSQNNEGETKIKVLSVSLTLVSYQTGH